VVTLRSGCQNGGSQNVELSRLLFRAATDDTTFGM
jgi:hypothetical protein